MEVERAESPTCSSKNEDITECPMSEAEDGELVDEPLEVSHDQNKLLQRAKRFGLLEHHVPQIRSHDKTINCLYSSMGVTSDTRLEALHLFGTDNMKTQDIFAYFGTNPPASVEWISDKTCNAVWLDEKSCATALLQSSIKIKGLRPSRLDASDSSEDEECMRIEDLHQSLPPGVWRKGQTKQFAPNLFIRFATRFDKQNLRKEGLPPHPGDYPGRKYFFPDEGDEHLRKFRPESDNPWSDLARQWGHYEQKTWSKEKTLLRDARDIIKKRELREPVKENKDTYFPHEELDDRKNDQLYGRMQADIEERKLMERKSYKRHRRYQNTLDLRHRLGNKRLKVSKERRRDDSTSSEEGDFRIEVEKVKSRLGEETWVGYESDESSGEEHMEETNFTSTDLRQKLTKGAKPFVARSPLRIEIDNDIYYSGNISDGNSSESSSSS